MHFVIDRKKWARGLRIRNHATLPNKLLDSEGMQCCIGQVCSQLGVEDYKLLRRATVFQLNIGDRPEMLTNQRFMEKAWVDACYECNDNSLIDDATRELLITERFTENGHTIEFVN